MDNKDNIIELKVEVDTIYGSISRGAWFDKKQKEIDSKEKLEMYLDYVFGIIKAHFLKEFEKLENENKNEVINEQGQ